jgi:hypothetical protein
VFTGCTDFTTTAAALGVNVAGGSSVSTFNSGVTINITDTGWIRYDTPTVSGFNQFFSTTGNKVLAGCVDCESIRFAYPFADLANWTIITCGTACP